MGTKGWGLRSGEHSEPLNGRIPDRKGLEEF
jgi:hypothetical protein